MTRADKHRNPTAFTAEVARQARLQLGVDYLEGEPFRIGVETYHTAQLLGDPIALTIKVINQLGFYTGRGAQRWAYIAVPMFVWNALSFAQKKLVIEWMYKREGGSELKGLFESQESPHPAPGPPAGEAA